MPDLYRDISRMEMMDDSCMGLEGFHLGSRVQDFTSYYFSRFLNNIKLAFKDFTHSEISDYSKRYARVLDATLRNPQTKLSDLVVPVPAGMIGSYGDTFGVLLDLLERISAETLKSDLEGLVAGPEIKTNTFIFGKGAFEQAKVDIGALYSTHGLTYAKADRVLGSVQETKVVKDHLETTTVRYYHEILIMSHLIGTFETLNREKKIDLDQNQTLRASIMDTAYRVSIFAIVMNHIQEMEHAFVKALEVLRKNELR